MAAAKDLGLRGDDAAAVRKRIGDVAQKALGKLAEELEIYKPKPAKRARGKGAAYDVLDVVTNGVPCHWVERFAKIADQLRRDYVIDESADSDSAPDQQPETPLPLSSRLKVV